MKIVLLCGTQHNGITTKLKNFVVEELSPGNDIREFLLPRDAPSYCTGCKRCFYEDERLCPHADKVMPIWDAMLESDLIVFVYPTYVMRVPGHVKAVLDHLACHWMPHRPEPRLFDRRAAIITQSLGAPTFGARRDVKVSLNWMGISSVTSLGLKLLDHAEWELLTPQRRAGIEAKTRAFARRLKTRRTARKSVKHRAIFMLCRTMQRNVLKKFGPSSADTKYWLDKEWIREKNATGS